MKAFLHINKYPLFKKRLLSKITTCQHPNFLILLQRIYQIIENVITVKEKTIKFLFYFEGYLKQPIIKISEAHNFFLHSSKSLFFCKIFNLRNIIMIKSNEERIFHQLYIFTSFQELYICV